jgi:hypothetical protein
MGKAPFRPGKSGTGSGYPVARSSAAPGGLASRSFRNRAMLGNRGGARAPSVAFPGRLIRNRPPEPQK